MKKIALKTKTTLTKDEKNFIKISQEVKTHLLIKNDKKRENISDNK